MGDAGRSAAGIAGGRVDGSDVATFAGLAVGIVAMVVASRAAHAAVTRAIAADEGGNGSGDADAARERDAGRVG